MSMSFFDAALFFFFIRVAASSSLQRVDASLIGIILFNHVVVIAMARAKRCCGLIDVALGLCWHTRQVPAVPMGICDEIRLPVEAGHARGGTELPLGGGAGSLATAVGWPTPANTQNFRENCVYWLGGSVAQCVRK